MKATPPSNAPGSKGIRLRPDLWLEWWASRDPDKPAILYDGRILTYRGLWSRVVRLATALAEEGLKPGDRIACLTANHPAFLETYFASSLLGAIFVPLNFRLSPPEVHALLEDAEPAILVIGRTTEDLQTDLLDGIEPRPLLLCLEDAALREGLDYEGLIARGSTRPPPSYYRRLSPEDPQMIMYTSGTTGRPKGALLPYRKTLYNNLNAQAFFELGPTDMVLVPVPLFHSLGLNILSLPVLYMGGTIDLMKAFDPGALLREVHDRPITFLGAVPTIFARMLEYGLPEPAASRLRFCFTAGAPMPLSLIEAYHRRGLLMKQGFGQTETSILCCLDARDAIRKAGSVGKPVPHAEVKVVDDRLQEVPPGRRGEIVARGPILMLGYWRRPEETRLAFRGPWLLTQDLAVRDEEGFITLQGRKGDLFISGGENIVPEEIERVYRLHPGIVDVAVVGVPDPDLGEVGLACVVPRPGTRLDEEDLRRFARGRLAGYKVPRRFVEVSSLPRTVTGKVQRYRLRERFGGSG